jgi:hypothetical protein
MAGAKTAHAQTAPAQSGQPQTAQPQTVRARWSCSVTGVFRSLDSVVASAEVLLNYKEAAPRRPVQNERFGQWKTEPRPGPGTLPRADGLCGHRHAQRHLPNLGRGPRLAGRQGPRDAPAVHAHRAPGRSGSGCHRYSSRVAALRSPRLTRLLACLGPADAPGCTYSPSDLPTIKIVF